jgi:hypothetical protein
LQLADTDPQKHQISTRRCAFGVVATLALIIGALAAVSPLVAQDDVTTQNASTAIDGGWITGPASNPLSFLNGPAFRTFGSALPYDFPDFRPMSATDDHLPRWIRFEAEERFRFEQYHGASFHLGNNDAYLLNRFRFQMDLRLNSWFSFISQVQDARPFFENPPIGPPNENRWDLKLAYTEFGDPEQHWISVRVGRQLINYNSTVMASSEWRNQGRSYDAIVTNLQRGQMHLGIFAASAVVPLASGISHHEEGNNIYGLYGRIEKIVPNSSLEPFVLWRVQPSVTLYPTVSKATGKQDLKAYGLRFKGRSAANLDYSVEAVVESGHDGPDTIRAWAATGGVAHEFAAVKARPRLFTQYDFASGNHAPGDGTHRTFDTIYPTTHDRFGILDQFGWQNIQAVRGGVTVTPHERWTVSTQYLDFHVASANDAAYNLSGGVIGFGNGKYGTHLGQEADAYSWYEINRHLNIGAGYGWFTAGGFISHIATSNMYSGAYVAINFKDNGRSRPEPR